MRADSKTKESDEYLLNAAAEGKLYELKQALRAGADIEAKDKKFGNTAVMWASLQGNIEIINVLLQHGADIEAKSIDGHKTPLMFAAYKGNLKTVQYLLSKGALCDYKNIRGDSALSLASYMGHADVVKEILKRRPYVDSQSNKDGYTALHFAAYKGIRLRVSLIFYYIITGHLDVVRSLVKAGADIDLTEASGKSAVMLAAVGRHHLVISYLISKG